MIVKYEFNTEIEDDKERLATFQQAEGMQCMIFDLSNAMRAAVKYSEDDLHIQYADHWRTKLFEYAADHGVDLNLL